MKLSLSVSLPNTVKPVKDCKVGEIIKFDQFRDCNTKEWVYIYAGKFRNGYMGIVLFNNKNEVGEVTEITQHDDTEFEVIGNANFTFSDEDE